MQESPAVAKHRRNLMKTFPVPIPISALRSSETSAGFANGISIATCRERQKIQPRRIGLSHPAGKQKRALAGPFGDGSFSLPGVGRLGFATHPAQTQEASTHQREHTRNRHGGQCKRAIIGDKNVARTEGRRHVTLTCERSNN